MLGTKLDGYNPKQSSCARFHIGTGQENIKSQYGNSTGQTDKHSSNRARRSLKENKFRKLCTAKSNPTEGTPSAIKDPTHTSSASAGKGLKLGFE